MRLLFILFLFFYNCKENKSKTNTYKDDTTQNKTVFKKDTTIDTSKKNNLNDSIDFVDFCKKIKTIKNTYSKHSDWMSNRIGFTDALIGLNQDSILIKTTSYEYKKKCVFYVHNIKHIDNNISIKPYLENAQGKATIGYTTERVLLFAMKNDKEANFIDIPPNWNHIDLADELLEILYKKVNSDIILCYRTKNCIYKDLRKNK